MPQTNPPLDLRKLRKQIRQQRRALNPQQQTLAANRLKKKLIRSPLFLRSRHIAFYLPNDGEINPTPVMEEAWKRGKFCYLPVLSPFGGKLLFVRFEKGDELILNKFSIPEPNPLKNRCRQAWALDIVITPLVAFDNTGGRIGMGGGYYDRSFAFLKQKRAQKPKLLGVAHTLQKRQQLPIQPWDIPLDAVFTD
ncbi:MAG: 5-formyltetrahydrofolate cyclo-ligase [Pseudomonadales bacterium]|nr:5-formyltetrahydrofolate cyclo-ligase [Pseudomonadales bacterium]